jgi:acyl-CoA thioesterase II
VNAGEFLAILDVASDGAGRYVLPVADPAAGRVFGGQMLAQVIWAAAPAGSGKSVRSVHVAFPREARPADTLYLDLETTHDGRSIGLRRAVVWQQAEDSRRVVATASVLLDRADDGPEYQLGSGRAGDPELARPARSAVVPGETRLISTVGLDDERAVPAELGLWIRCAGLAEPSVGGPLVAYVSDWPVIGTLLKAVPGVSERDAHVALETGVVTHSVWFHQPFDATGWLRLEVRGRRLAGGRGFGTGEVFTRSGAHVASFAQESVIRQPRANRIAGPHVQTGARA